jgi:hypothetical protein
MIDLQQIFNAAWQLFIVEDNPPAMEDGVCKYLCKDGRKCAIGLCIPDGHPAQQSPCGFTAVAAENRDIFGDLADNCTLFELGLFQRYMHDDLARTEGGWAYSRDERELRYRRVAADYKLTVPE